MLSLPATVTWHSEAQCEHLVMGRFSSLPFRILGAKWQYQWLQVPGNRVGGRQGFMRRKICTVQAQWSVCGGVSTAFI